MSAAAAVAPEILRQILGMPVYQLPGLTPEQMSRIAGVVRPALEAWENETFELSGADLIGGDLPLREHRGPPATIRELVEFWPSSHLGSLGLTLADLEAVQQQLASIGLRLPDLGEAVDFHYRRLSDGPSDSISLDGWVSPEPIFRDRKPEPLFDLLVGLRGWLATALEDSPGGRATSTEIERALPELLSAHSTHADSPAGFYLEVGLQDGRALWAVAAYQAECWTSILLGDLSGLAAAITPRFGIEVLHESSARQQWVEGFLLRAAQHEYDPRAASQLADALWLPNRGEHSSVFQAQALVRDRRRERPDARA